MNDIDEQIKECQKREREYKRLIMSLDLMRLAFARSIATEAMNIAELKKRKEREKNE